MPDYPHLAHAPLREALIDIQRADELPVSFAEGLGEIAVGGCRATGEIRRTLPLPVGAVDSASSVASDELFGWRYQSEDASRIIQFRRNGLTYSILRSYTNWEDIKAATQAAWSVYAARSGNLSIQRLAVRYINVLQLPLAAPDLDVYLTAAPRIPAGLPQSLSGFVQRIVVPFADVDAFATITQALEAATPTKLSVILDIDVQKRVDLAGDSHEIGRELDKLREIKNSIFFSSVTNKCLEAYR